MGARVLLLTNMVQYASYRVFSKTEWDQSWPLPQWIPEPDEHKEIIRGFRLGPEIDCSAFYNEYRKNIAKSLQAVEDCDEMDLHLGEHVPGFNEPEYEPGYPHPLRRQGVYVESSDGDSSGGSPSKKRARAHMQLCGSGGNVCGDETTNLEAEVDSPYDPLACTTAIGETGQPRPSIQAKHPPAEPKSRMWPRLHYN